MNIVVSPATIIIKILQHVKIQNDVGVSLSFFLPATTTATQPTANATDAADATTTSAFPNTKQLISYDAAWSTSGKTGRSPSLGTATPTRKTPNSVTAR